MKKISLLSITILFNCLSAFSQNNPVINDDLKAYQPIIGATDTNFVNELKNSGAQFPEFQGGQEALSNYLSQNVRYPHSARKRNIEGRVVVRFVVCTDGSLCDEEVVKSVDSSIDQEALRVVKSMPKWKPGIKDGKPVKVYYTLPFTFSLGKKEK